MTASAGHGRAQRLSEYRERFCLTASAGYGRAQHLSEFVEMLSAFLGLLWPRLTSGFLRIVAVISMAFALVITPWLPAGLPIIASVLVAFVCGWRER